MQLEYDIDHSSQFSVKVKNLSVCDVLYAFVVWTGTTLPFYHHAYIIYALRQMLLRHSTFKQDQVVRACGMHGGDEKCGRP